jgi:hypothetical protein
MTIDNLELKGFVYDKIRKTVNKFREYPSIFFSEMDLHSYLYHCLYSSKLEVKTKEGITTSCIHKEYPTNFRYSKETMEDYGLRKIGRRGNFDLVVLNPDFIEAFDIKNVVNKDIRDVEKRSQNTEKFRDELLIAIEIKYVVNNSKSFVEEVEKDIEKLSIASKYQSFEAYNLVFCNHEYRYMNELKKIIEKPNPTIRNLLAISFYRDSKKVTPKPITNGWNI